MAEKFYIDGDESLAAVKFDGRWRFFYDIEVMFLLDYSKYEGNHKPKLGEWRYGTIIVSSANAEQWMNQITHELTIEQLKNVIWKDGDVEEPVGLTFVIDFDAKVWIGMNWKMDQSPLQDYQPDGWRAEEGDGYAYLPPEIAAYFE